MTLTPAEFVRWEVDGAHHTGRVMRCADNAVVSEVYGLCDEANDADRVLVRHSFTHDLEFVPWGELVVCPEEHPE